MVTKGVLAFTIICIQLINAEHPFEESGSESVLLNYVKLMNAIKQNFDDDIKQFGKDVVVIMTEADTTIRQRISDLVNQMKAQSADIKDDPCISNTLKTIEVLNVHTSLQLCANKRNELLIEDKIEKLEKAGVVLDSAFTACNVRNNSAENDVHSCVEKIAEDTTTKLHELKTEVESSLEAIRQDIKDCTSKVVTAATRSLEVAAEYFESCSYVPM